MTYRTAETFLPYPAFSILETPVILRMTIGHSVALQKQRYASPKNDIFYILFGRSKPLPYRKRHSEFVGEGLDPPAAGRLSGCKVR